MPSFLMHCVLYNRPALWLLAFCLMGSMQAQQEQKTTVRQQLRLAVVASFTATHDGFSSDEVLLRDDLNEKFIEDCQKRLAALEGISEFDINWTLLNLRKAGQLDVKTTKRTRLNTDHVLPMAEMCARMMEDRHGKSIDRLMADPATRLEFDQAVSQIDPQVDHYLVRKAAFKLRKTRQLQPELLTRLADWGRQVDQHGLTDVQKQPDIVPDVAGIYIFRNSEGYLYIGEAKNLRDRLQQHLDSSDNKSLADHLENQGLTEITIELHTFTEGSRIEELRVRRAYESELIRSRSPRFNIRP